MSPRKFRKLVLRNLEGAGYTAFLEADQRATRVVVTRGGKTERFTISDTPRCPEYAARAALQQANHLFSTVPRRVLVGVDPRILPAVPLARAQPARSSPSRR